MTCQPDEGPEKIRQESLASVTWSVAFYRALVVARYRRGFRDRFGARMVADFEQLATDAVASAGWRGLARSWRLVLRDLSRSVPGPLPQGDVAEARTDKATVGAPRGAWGRGLLEDGGFAMRSLRREPRFAAVVVAVLSVAVALNVAVFSVTRAYLLRPLPYPHAERLVAATAWGAVSWTEVEEVMELAVSWDLDVFTIVDGERPEMVRGAWVTPDFLTAYAVDPALGRTFAPDEAGPAGAGVAMISHRLWRDRFASAPDVLGRTFRAYMADRPDEAELFTIVGVLPSDFWYFNSYTDVLAPIRGARSLYTGRLRPDVGLEEAEEFLTRLAAPRLESPPPDFRVTLEPLQEQYVQTVRPTLSVVLIAVGLVLLIAFANTAVILLLRATRREREVAVRSALGATRLRIARQMFAEGLLMSGVAGAVGTALAGVALGGWGGLVEARLGRAAPGGTDALALDATALLLAVALSLGLGVAFGIVSLASLDGRRAAAALRTAGGGSDRGRRWARDVLVAAEIALSLALLTGAGLMVRSALHLQSRELGFDPSGVVVAGVGLRESSYPTAQDRQRFFDRLTEAVATLPEVSSVAIASQVPFGGRGAEATAEVPDGSATAEVSVSHVGEGFFATLRVPLTRGRDFGLDDVPGGEPVAIVSEALAGALWPGADPLGRQLRTRPPPRPDEAAPEPGPMRRVVGVVAEVEYGIDPNGRTDLYVPARQEPTYWMELLTRVEVGVGPVTPAIQAALRDVDPEVPLYEPEQLSASVEAARAPTRFLAALLVGFSAFAFLLAVLGLYGVIAYAARQSRREIAIRMALGADRDRVIARFVASGLAVAVVGVALGTGGGFVLGRALEGHLHGVRPGDPLTQGGFALALLTASLVAVWWPARGAAAADPVGVLRED